MESVFGCQAIANEPFFLPTGAAIGVPVYRTRFNAATERIRFENGLYDIKPQLEFDGEVLLAELVIVRCLERNGWNALWIDNFKNKRWRELPVHGTPMSLPENLEAMLQSITKLNGRRAGAFDVLAWKGASVAFLESKGPGDSISEKQRAWFASAVAAGVPTDSFSIVEWSYVDPARATRGELTSRSKGRAGTASANQVNRRARSGSPTGEAPRASPTGGSAQLPPGAGPREVALADRLPAAVVGSVRRAGYTLCAAQALDSDGRKYPSRIRAYLNADGRLNAQGRAARDEVRRLGFKLTE
jgi:hypothetical protein